MKNISKVTTAITPLFANKKSPRNVSPEKIGHAWFGGNPRMAVDHVTGELYLASPGGTPGGTLIRLDGKTGQLDKTWFNGALKHELNNISEVDVGTDGFIYVTSGPMGYSRFIARFAHDGKPVPFKEKGEEIPTAPMINGWWEKAPQLISRKTNDPYALTAILATGVSGHSNIHDKGFDVSFSGRITLIVEGIANEWAQKHELSGDLRHRFVQVWTTEGKLLASEAVRSDSNWGHGVRMDRDGNLYIVRSGTMPAGQDMLDGIKDVKVGYRVFGGHGTLLKFRGMGDKFPLDTGPGVKVNKGEEINGALWAYGGISDQMVPDCSCNHSRFDIDGWARIWIPARHLCSVIVLDSNCNRIARLGKYGNIDDEGLAFAWPRGIAVSDNTLYIRDDSNQRVLKAVLKYVVEEEIAMP